MITLRRLRARGCALSLIAGGCTLGPAGRADDPIGGYVTYSGHLYPHPTAIFTTYGGKAYPIIGVSGEDPQIAVGDATKTLRSSDQTYRPMRVAAYAPGSVRIGNQDASSTVTNYSIQFGNRMGPIPAGSDYRGNYSCTVVAPEDHADCYVVVLFYRQLDDGTPIPGTIALGFGRLGNLKAGQPAVATIYHSYVVGAGVTFYLFPMVFSHGRELRSNYSSAADLFFHQQEVADHPGLVQQYATRYKGADHAPVPYLQIPLALPGGVDPHSLPPKLQATFSVDELGGVDSVQLPAGLSPGVRQTLTEEIEGWMFLPRLKQGEPVRTLVSLPLVFN